MSRIERFFGKPVEIELEGEKLLIHPLTVKNMDIVMDLGDDLKKADAMKRMLMVTLKKTFPEEKEEDVERFALTHFQELIEAIMKANNLEMSEDMKKVDKFPKV